MITFARILIFCAIFLLLLNIPSESTAQPSAEIFPYGKAVLAGRIFNGAMKEISGLASSQRRNDILWAINDGGNAPTLFALNFKGQDRGAHSLVNIRNQDWEDLASFQLKGIPYLLIADVGDNFRLRNTYSLYIVREPMIDNRLEANDDELSPAWSIRFSYPDGAHDCEAVAVDAVSLRVLLVTKRTVPPILYEVPLIPGENHSVQKARPVGEITNILLPSSGRGKSFDRPTAMDLSPDGSLAVILTYRHAYLFVRRQGEQWREVFRRIPRHIRLPLLPQAEALCLGPDGRTIFITSERSNPPLYRLEPIKKSGP
ncbi:hypothetical protein ACFL9T_04870 [Thermodesulfobacteriota bacterium]